MLSLSFYVVVLLFVQKARQGRERENIKGEGKGRERRAKLMDFFLILILLFSLLDMVGK